ncbi:AAA family ATPase [Nostoc sp. CHAB 5834]|nr:AAA family ATPase [Nostoc sp. CHAB 5834]
MKQADFQQRIVEARKNVYPDCFVVPTFDGPFPYFDTVSRTSSLAYASIFTVQEGINQHNVVLAAYMEDGNPQFMAWCGDKFAEKGRLGAREASERISEALAGNPNKVTLAKQMSSVQGQLEISAACNFWTGWQRERKFCKHVNAVLDSNPRDHAQFLADGLSALSANGGEVDPGDLSANEEGFNLPYLAFKVPVLFEGDRGSGKTRESRMFARQIQASYVEMGGHEGVEATDMLGCLVPYRAGELVWKDGPISEAFRKARGEKTVLLIDELLRIPQEHLSILLTAFSPDDTDEESEPVYRLRTGRILSVSEDGVAQEEYIECPVGNLCVIATTNVGAEYAVEELDPALGERFVILRKDTTSAKLKQIISAKLAERKFPPLYEARLLNFYNAMVQLKKDESVSQAPTTRTIVRAIQLARSEHAIREALEGQALLWVGRDLDGHPIAEQMAKVVLLLDKLFPETKVSN